MHSFENQAKIFHDCSGKIPYSIIDFVTAFNSFNQMDQTYCCNFGLNVSMLHLSWISYTLIIDRTEANRITILTSRQQQHYFECDSLDSPTVATLFLMVQKTNSIGLKSANIYPCTFTTMLPIFDIFDYFIQLLVNSALTTAIINKYRA
jgi:hypothetical protein